MPDIKEKFENAVKLTKSREFFQAADLYNEILEETPENIEALNNLGKVYIDMNDFYEAINCYKQSITRDFDNYDSWFYLAYALNENKQVDEAIIAYQRALFLNPKSASSYRNLGNIYYTNKNEPSEAVKYYEKLLELEPGNLSAKGALGAAYLKIKNFEKGWEYFESRPNKDIVISIRGLLPNSPTTTKPVWNGEDITDKTLYVYYEGGFGDTIMYSRFLPLVKKKCKELLFRPQVGSIELFQENPLGAKVLDTSQPEETLKFDYHIPIMSLPYLLKLNKEKDFPAKQGFLKVNEKKVENYKKYFKTDKLKVGIKWHGTTVIETKRVIPIEVFYKILELKDVQFYSLQKDEGSEQLEKAKQFDIIDLSSTFNDFSDTAAAIENLDLVICNDTSVAHLAGALGKPCWMMVPFIQDWRWSIDLSYCMWYDSIKIFHQSENRNWYDVIDAVCEQLQQKIN